MAKRLKGGKVVVGEKRVRNDDGKLTLTVHDKLKAWQSCYQMLLNVEFLWNTGNMSKKAPVEVPAV